MSNLPQCDAYGFIYDKAGDPAPDVLVTLKRVIDASGNGILLGPLTTLTDSAGSFHFTLPEDATVFISARATTLYNCLDGGARFTVPSGPTGELIPDFVLPEGTMVIPPLIYLNNTLGMPKATTSQDGFLSAADFISFQSGGSTVAGVSAFNGRSGAVMPLSGDYAAFFAPMVHTHTRSQITDLGVFSTSQPGLVPQPAIGDAAKLLTGAGTWADPPAQQMPGTYLASDFKASGSKLTFIGTIATGALTTLTLTVASDFVVGQGIYIAGAGVGGAALITKVDAIDATKKIITLHVAATAAVTSVNVQHDETVALQTAIDTIVNAGGGTLRFPTPSYYRLNGPIQSSTNSILNAPFIPNSGYATVPLGFEADNQPFPAYQGPPVTGGCVFQTDKIGTNTESSILAFALWSAGLNGAAGSNITFTCRGITWRTYGNPQISGLDLALCANCIVENVLIDVGQDLLTTGQPTHAGTFGLRLPCEGAGMAIELTRNVYVIGYDIGAWFSEMWRSDYISVMRCNTGLKATHGFHLSLGWALILHCPIGIHFTDQNRIRFTIDFEHDMAGFGADWDITVHDLYDPTNQAAGLVEYLCIQGWTGNNQGIISPVGVSSMSLVNLGGLGEKTPYEVNIATLTVPILASLAGEVDLYDPATMGTTLVSIGDDDSASPGYRQVRVANSGVPSGDLMTGLVSMWKLDEASNTPTRVDSHGSNDLTGGANVVAATGKLAPALAAHFTGDGYLLGVSSNPSLQMGNVDYVWAMWVNLTGTTTSQEFLSKKEPGTGDDEIIIGYELASGYFRYTMGGGVYTTVLASSAGPPIAGSWYLVVAWHDATAATLNIQINNGPVNSVARPEPVIVNTSTVWFGAYGAGLSNLMVGLVDEVAFWKGRLLNVNSRNRLWNSGAGLPFTSW